MGRLLVELKSHGSKLVCLSFLRQSFVILLNLPKNIRLGMSTLFEKHWELILRYTKLTYLSMFKAMFAFPFAYTCYISIEVIAACRWNNTLLKM
jgi:hypothetical protein